jgi:hypothetical protein
MTPTHDQLSRLCFFGQELDRHTALSVLVDGLVKLLHATEQCVSASKEDGLPAEVGAKIRNARLSIHSCLPLSISLESRSLDTALMLSVSTLAASISVVANQDYLASNSYNADVLLAACVAVACELRAVSFHRNRGCDAVAQTRNAANILTQYTEGLL